MTLPVGNLGTRFGEGKMAFETTRLRQSRVHLRERNVGLHSLPASNAALAPGMTWFGSCGDGAERERTEKHKACR